MSVGRPGLDRGISGSVYEAKTNISCRAQGMMLRDGHVCFCSQCLHPRQGYYQSVFQKLHQLDPQFRCMWSRGSSSSEAHVFAPFLCQCMMYEAAKCNRGCCHGSQRPMKQLKRLAVSWSNLRRDLPLIGKAMQAHCLSRIAEFTGMKINEETVMHRNSCDCKAGQSAL